MQTTLRARTSVPAVAARRASSSRVAAKAPVAAFASLKVSSSVAAPVVAAKVAGLAAARRAAVAAPVALPSFVAEAKKSVGELVSFWKFAEGERGERVGGGGGERIQRLISRG